jgi:hypothetical protein
MLGSAVPGGDGKTHYSMSFSGKTGLSGIAPWLGTIGFNVSFSVDQSGKTRMEPGESQTKAFPSIEGYAYTMVQGELVINVLFNTSERDPDDLNGPQNVPLAPPQ